ncbi:MAG: recombinase family protein [Planctomycetes bacterium]|nr:recombinase family protein [Planctomycetota bacterium]
MGKSDTQNRPQQQANGQTIPWGSPRPNLLGLRYVNLLRCSNLTQADTSPDGQKRINDAFCSLSQMKWVDDVYAEGVSGSQTFNRDDIKELLDLHDKKPFDAVVVHDLSRLTRGGIRHGNAVEEKLLNAGIKLVSSTDFIPDGPEAELITSVKHYANQLQARSISLAVARGLAQSLAKGTRPAAGHNPYALDREYLGGDGKPRMLIRWQGMVQLWLKPDTLEEVGRAVRPPRRPQQVNLSKEQRRRERRERKRQQFKGYKKQDDETSRLVSGPTEKMDALVWMFSAHYVWGWGYHRIAKDLNKRNVPASDGGRWSLTSVRDVLYNPIYLGIEVRHRWTRALYNKLSEHGPVPVFVNQHQLEKDGRTTVPHVERPRDEWRLVDIPKLKDILPSPLREIAAARIMEKFDPDAPPHPKKGKPLRSGEAKHKHLDSPFLLTNILHSKQTGHRMRGEVVNKKLVHGRKSYRYYFDCGAAVHAERGLNVRRIPAEPLEQAVLGVIRQILGDDRAIAERMKTAATTLTHEQPNAGRQRETLLAEKESLSRRLRQAYKLLGQSGMESVAEQMTEDQKRLEELKAELKRIDQMHGEPELDPEQAAQSAIKHLTQIGRQMDNLPNAEMKQLLAALLEGLQIDLATGDLEFTVVLPTWLMRQTVTPQAGQEDIGGVRLGYKLPWPFTGEANSDGGRESILLSRWLCQKAEQKCYTCSRRRPAA